MSTYSIIIPHNPSESELFAAGELQYWLQEISGAHLEIKEVGQGVRHHRIIVGYSSDFHILCPDVRCPADEDESFMYRNIGGDIVICGGRNHGTMYGVYSFLENEFGCRWFTQSFSVIPHKDRYVFSKLFHTEKPAIQVRSMVYYGCNDPSWRARNRINGVFKTDADCPDKMFGGACCYWGCHTFDTFVPSSRYFSKHPEYFSMVNGRRLQSKTQLCLSNPEVLSLCIEGIKNRIRRSPEYSVYDLSQNDNINYCHCPACSEIAEHYGGQSGLMIWFVNKVAESVREEFPDKYIGTFAYQYTRIPPKNIRPASNVVIRLCDVENCFIHPLSKCEQNKEFVKEVEQWSALTKNLYVWDYVVNFRQFIPPYPNFESIRENIKLFRDSGVQCLLEQGNHASKGGDFAEFRKYLIAKLMWNPDQEVIAIAKDFFNAYYGNSAPYLLQYFLLLDKLPKNPDFHMGCHDKHSDELFPDSFIKEARDIFCKAEMAAENDEILWRVKEAELSVQYLWCVRHPISAKTDGTLDFVYSVMSHIGVTEISSVGIHLEEFKKFIRK